MRLAFHRRDEVLAFVTQRIRQPLDFANVVFEAVGVENSQGQLRAGALLYHYRPLLGGHDIELSVAAETGWYTRRHGPQLLRQFFGFAFWQLGCVRITAITPKSHKRARKGLEHLGFTLEGVVRWGLGYKKTACSYGMVFSACPWLTDADKAMIMQRVSKLSDAARHA